MKKKMMKSTLAVALVAAAAFGGAKTYGAYSATAESDQLLAENVEALSNDPGEGRKFRHLKCYLKECDSKQGEDAFICAEGTDKYTIGDCPSTQQKALPSSESGSCVIEIK